MSFATANRTQLSVIKETVPGQTPATPAFQKINYKGEDVNFNIGTITSESIREDRQISDLVRTSADVSGTVNVEVQVEAYEDLLAAALQGAWSSVINFSGDSIQVTAATRTITTGVAAFANAVVGQWIKVAGMNNAGNNGWHQIETVTDNLNVVVTAGSTGLADETELTAGTIKGKYLRNGVTKQSFTIEKLLNDATTPTYFRYRGCEVSQLDMNFETGAILNSSFGFIGRSSESDTAIITGATYANQSTNDFLDSVNSLGSVKEDGVASTSYFQSLGLSLNNNSQGQDAIGTLGYVGISHGSVALTGSTTIYFESKDKFEQYRNGTPFSISFVLSSAQGDMVVTIPRSKFSNMKVVASAINTDIVAEAEFQAIIDPTTNCMIQLDVDNVA